MRRLGHVLERWRKAGLVVPAIVALVVLGILMSLGTWQLQRKAWKDQLLADMATRMAAPPVDIGLGIFNIGAEKALAWTKVRLTGRFRHDKERFWFADGRLGSGFHVFTPFEVAANQVVWIDRGYIPAALKDPTARAMGQIPGEVTITGIVHISGEKNSFTPGNDVAGNVWFWRDLPTLQASAFVAEVIAAPVMVDDMLKAAPGGWPEGGLEQLPQPHNRHLEYAVTWYGLAATLIGVFFAFTRERLRAATE